MNKPISITLDKIVSVSQARSNLSQLLDKVRDKDFLVLSKRYKPKAALVDLDFLAKLIDIYRRWQRKQDFATLEEIRQSIPLYSEEEIQKDVARALKKIRKV